MTSGLLLLHESLSAWPFPVCLPVPAPHHLWPILPCRLLGHFWILPICSSPADTASHSILGCSQLCLPNCHLSLFLLTSSFQLQFPEQPSAAALLISLLFWSFGKPPAHSPSSRISVSSHPWGLFPPYQCLSSAATVQVPQDLLALQVSCYTLTSCSQSAQNGWGWTGRSKSCYAFPLQGLQMRSGC